MRFRKKKTITIVLPDGLLLKMRLIPWIPTKKGCVWLASLAVGRSKRQINDWMKMFLESTAINTNQLTLEC